jgi:hypothetical protein
MSTSSDEERAAPRAANSVTGSIGPFIQAGSIIGDVRVRSLRPASPVPYELPGDVSSFVGRMEQFAELDALLVEAEQTPAFSPAVVAVVSGMAGIGKTALVTWWAHRRADHFPDGQLYVDLRGYGPDSPLTASQALGELLRSLGVPNRHLPRGVGARAKRFRSLVAGRRMLVVLDNANADEQVRPVLPGTPSCLMVITSRDSLGGLVSRDGARRVRLGLLSQWQSLELLLMLIGARVGQEMAAANELVRHCARLPLALRIAADLAVSSPDAPLAELVNELSDEQHRLDLLDAGSDPRTAVRAVFSWSYRGLPAAEARIFRLLGRQSAREFSATKISTLAGIDLFHAARLLMSLAQVHLIERAENRSYQMHDLLRVYAAELEATETGG